MAFSGNMVLYSHTPLCWHVPWPGAYQPVDHSQNALSNPSGPFYSGSENIWTLILLVVSCSKGYMEHSVRYEHDPYTHICRHANYLLYQALFLTGSIGERHCSCSWEMTFCVIASCLPHCLKKTAWNCWTHTGKCKSVGGFALKVTKMQDLVLI